VSSSSSPEPSTLEQKRAPRLLNLIAELTYRCPLRCPYCSNPTNLAGFPDALDAAKWTRVFRQAADLGAVHVGLTGGEPSARHDLVEIVAGASEAGLYSHLVTAGLPLDERGLAALQGAGLCSVQVSIQDADAEASDALAGSRCFERKLALCRAVRALGLPLTLNVVLHRRNLERVEALIVLARQLDADRLELAHVQYQGFALYNREALLPTRRQIDRAGKAVARARRESPRPEILLVLPDYFREHPKPCMGGWARTHLLVTPDGRALPCGGAAGLPGLEFWNVREHDVAACWQHAPGMNAFRGEAWLPEPCHSCPDRGRDFGGCRCQAFALLGDATATDPVCRLSPQHAAVTRAVAQASERPDEGLPLVYRHR